VVTGEPLARGSAAPGFRLKRLAALRSLGSGIYERALAHCSSLRLSRGRERIARIPLCQLSIPALESSLKKHDRGQQPKGEEEDHG
jgi:hypothetical protein